jgi:hypothetical protein
MEGGVTGTGAVVRRATWRRSAIAVLALAAVALAGCAGPRGPELIQAIEEGYPGHVELAPKLAVGRDVGSFPYTPGTLIFALATDAEGNTWTAQTDLRCGHRTPITKLSATRLAPYTTSTGVAISARQRARGWLAMTTGISIQNLAGVSSVRVALTDVRRVAPGPRELERLTAEAAKGCPFSGVPGWRSVEAVLIGDVQVDVRFEQGLSLDARLALLDKLSLSFGAGYQRISERSILGRQVAFAVRWK